MILADTSVWVQHFRTGEPRLSRLLPDAQVYMHPHVLGEIACGNLKNRAAVLGALGALPPAVSATDDEVMDLIEGRRLWGRGLGWTDQHLIASALLSHCGLLTLDKRLAEAAADVGVGS